MSYAKEMIQMLNDYHSQREVWDSDLEFEILKHEAFTVKKPPITFPPRDFPYFSPSSANSCPRELYLKVKKAKRDEQETQPHQSRWQKCGSMYGSLIQRELLFIEKHYEKLLGKAPSFIPQRTSIGLPFWEGHVKTAKKITHNGHTFYLFGTLDGKLLSTKNNESVGLEIKTKQTSHAQTGHYKMKEINTDHLKQVFCYGIMYDIEHYVVLYGNLSKKGWVMTEEESKKYPDIRAFDVKITEEDKTEVLDYFAYILDCVEKQTPPPLDLTKFNFNNFKTACALDLSDEEMKDLKNQVSNALKSNLPDYLKNQYRESYEFILGVRHREQSI